MSLECIYSFSIVEFSESGYYIGVGVPERRYILERGEVRVGGEGGRREWCIMYVSMCECVGSYQATEMYEAFMLY